MRRLSRYRNAALALALLAGACTANSSAEQEALSGRVYAPDGVAINGYDPVAYFTEGRPVKGDRSHQAAHEGAVFWFASAENRDRFVAAPERYAPQYGGFCAYGMSEGYKATTEPDAFTVHEGRLYLNYNREVRDLWNQDRPGRIAAADKNWPRVSAE